MKGNEGQLLGAQNERVAYRGHLVMDEALATVESFTSLNDSEQEAHSGMLRTWKITDAQGSIGTIEKTIAFAKDCLVQTFSWQARKDRRDQARVLQDTLLRSIHLIAISAGALQELEQGTIDEQKLAKRMRNAALSYNAVIRKAVSQPETLFSKIKRFFFDVSTWGIDRDLLREIRLPDHLEPGSAGGHKITSPKEDTTSKKIATLIQGNPFHPGLEEPCRLQELDAFHLKAVALLQEQEVVPFRSFQECRQALSDAHLEMSVGEITAQSAIITIKQTVWHFPGEGVELSGSFQRDIVTPHISIPIKGTFACHPKIAQTGFLHPLQRAGFALSLALLPQRLPRAEDMPRYGQLLHKKREIASELLPEGALNRSAKALVERRREAFCRQPELLVRQKECVLAFVTEAAFPDAGAIATIDRFFDAISTKTHAYDLAARACAEVNELVFERALERIWATLHHKWLLRSLPDPLSAEYLEQLLHAECAKMQRLMESPRRSEWDSQKMAYQKLLAHVLIERAAPLLCLRLSEELGIAVSKVLPDVSRKLFDYLVISFTDFVEELEGSFERPPEDMLLRDAAYFCEKRATYTKEAEELFTYYLCGKGSQARREE